MCSRFQAMVAAVGLGVAVSCAAGSAQAQNLVTNGSFELSTNGPGQLGYNTNATGWSSSASNAYNFLFASGTADSLTNSPIGQYGNLPLWGPNDGSANGLPASSPDGGNFVGADGAFQVGAIQQTINGLTVGSQYVVGFYWAAAQQDNFYGPNTEQWQVSLGSETQSTAVYSNASQGFSGWMYQTFTFTADATSDVLSFLAIGTPSGEPPFSLLDGVSMSAPEPASLALLGVGVVGLGGVLRRRRRAGKPCASMSA